MKIKKNALKAVPLLELSKMWGHDKKKSCDKSAIKIMQRNIFIATLKKRKMFLKNELNKK
ncbi:MAG: hypothetical protein HN888_02910 [Desulfobacula sp.]|nr:hypothetical protein [Desulfobacula sp.]